MNSTIDIAGNTSGLTRGLSSAAPAAPVLGDMPSLPGTRPGPSPTDLARWQGELDHRLSLVEARVKQAEATAKDGRGVRLVATIWLGVIALSLLVFSGYVVFGDLDSGAEPSGPTLTGVPTWTA